MRRKLGTLALPVGAVVVLGLGAAWLPSYAHDDGDESRDAAAQTSVGSETGAEEPHTHDKDSEADPYFDRYDAEGNVVIAAYPSPKATEDIRPKTAAEAAADGPITGEAPCEGYSMAVGK